MYTLYYYIFLFGVYHGNLIVHFDFYQKIEFFQF